LALAGVVVFVWLRPDPMLVLHQEAAEHPEVSGRHEAAAPSDSGRSPGRFTLILAEFRVNRQARYALIAILSAQIVMVSIMTMTPVHLAHHGDSITIIGLTISLHVAGMYALAPVVGALTDRFGPRPAITVGIGILLVSALIGVLWPD